MENPLLDKPLYVRVLEHASNRGAHGFTGDELKKAVAPQNENEWQWVLQAVLYRTHGDDSLIYSIGSGKDTKYYLNAAGAEAYTNYLVLKHTQEVAKIAQEGAKDAQKSSANALAIAYGALIVSILVGFVQIAFTGWQIFLVYYPPVSSEGQGSQSYLNPFYTHDFPALPS